MSWNQGSLAAIDVRDARVTAFLSKVYGWMFLGLLITAGTAMAVASSPFLIRTIVLNRILFWVLVFGQLGLVFFLSARVEKMSPATAGGLFMLYSATVGLTTSVILLMYTGASLVSTFVVTAGMFGSLALFGTFTAEESRWRRSVHGYGIDRIDPRDDRGDILAEHRVTVCDFCCWCDRVYGFDGVGRAAAQAHGGRVAGGASW